jgi:hypothetical protein
MQKLILITAVLFIGLANFIPYVTKTRQQQQILAATVMISITAPNWQETAEKVEIVLPIPNDEYRTIARADGEVVADGLGTLVAHGDELLLVTHDHWRLFDEVLGTVTFRAADSRFLAKMELREFKQHLRYRDGGTMVLGVPDVLATAVSDETYAAVYTGSVYPGQDALVVQRAADGAGVDITAANVVKTSEKRGQPVARLQSENGRQVVGGDSGGGVWVNGRLAANLWTAVVLENTTTGEQRATDLSIAAVYNGTPSGLKPHQSH